MNITAATTIRGIITIFFRHPTFLFGLSLFCTLSSARAVSVTLAWDQSSDHTVAGYRVFYGNYSGNYSQTLNVGLATRATVPNVTAGRTYFFVVTAYTASGIQSGPSNQVIFRASPGTGRSGPVAAIAATPFLSYSGDFNGDGKQDILWRNMQTGEVDIWYLKGGSVVSKDRIGVIGLDWTIAGIGDFDGSGFSDILWENSVNGQFGIWVMHGDSYTGYGFPSQGNQWSIAGIADLNHSGRAGIIWRNIVTGELLVWNSTGPLRFAPGRLNAVGLDWNLVGSADIFGNGQPALIWRSVVTGEVIAWQVNGGTVTAQTDLGTVPTYWEVAGFGKFDGNGRTDILWRNSLDGSVVAWLMNGFQTSQAWIHQGAVSQDWQIRATPSVSNNGLSSILWSDMVTGQQVLWQWNGREFSTVGVLGWVPSSWLSQP